MPTGKWIRTKEQNIAMSKILKGKTNKGSFKKGQKPHNFKGRYISKEGYVFIYHPDHPNASGRKKYVMEHRLVMEKHIGRYLTSMEQIHHINEIRNDNRIENLNLCSDNSEHRKIHAKKYKYKKQCSWCHKVKSLKHFQMKNGRLYSWCYPCIWLKRKSGTRAQAIISRSISTSNKT